MPAKKYREEWFSFFRLREDEREVARCVTGTWRFVLSDRRLEVYSIPSRVQESILLDDIVGIEFPPPGARSKVPDVLLFGVALAAFIFSRFELPIIGRPATMKFIRVSLVDGLLKFGYFDDEKDMDVFASMLFEAWKSAKIIRTQSA